MYERYYQEFHEEVEKALASYYIWRKLQNDAAGDKKLLQRLNRSPISWILIRYSLQVNLFMTLGRVFDIDGDAFSIDDLVKSCVENPDLFSAQSLRKRRIDDNKGIEPDYLSDYLKSVYEPAKEDFLKLRGEIAKRRKIFQENYQPIRHKILAHNSKKHMDVRDSLWEQTNIGELEEILAFLYDITETLFDSYHNGRKPELTGRVPKADRYEADFEKLLNAVRGT